MHLYTEKSRGTASLVDNASNMSIPLVALGDSSPAVLYLYLFIIYMDFG